MSCGIFIKENIVKMGDYKNEKYPVGALKPKAETNVLSFLQKYPEYNGKDTIIAILGKLFLHKKWHKGLHYSIIDSGVDPLAGGLQKLPNGDVKVIERVRFLKNPLKIKLYINPQSV